MAITSVSAIDGRYAKSAKAFADSMSEYALIKARVYVECEYLIQLLAVIPKAPKLSAAQKGDIRSIAEMSEDDAVLVKKIETEGYGTIPATNHDVKAVEYFIRIALEKRNLHAYIPWVHFGVTSEDVNNLSYALMLRGALTVLRTDLEAIEVFLSVWSKTHAQLPMLARTHGQSASPTTFGKEMAVFLSRLRRQKKQLDSATIQAKWNGATGNYNAFYVSYPKIDWQKFSKSFVESFTKKGDSTRIEWNPVTTQIESHDSYIEVMHVLHRTNTILTGFSQDLWRYVSDGWIGLQKKEGEVGSSTMPHKVNPIDFENAEGNFQIANGLFETFARRLPVSRLQRDLSDSTTLRAMGTAFAHAHIAYQSCMRGLNKCAPHKENIAKALHEHPEVITEALQTILRREQVPNAYELLKQASRGSVITLESLHVFIDGLPVSEHIKQELRLLTPEGYTGIAALIAKSAR